MPAVFEKLGVRFEYPDSWKIDEEEARESGDTITVYSPGGAFWTLNIVSEPGVDHEELTAASVEAMRDEYDELDASPVTEMLDGVELTGYDMNFYCLDLTNTARVRAVERQQTTYVILCQAEDREFDVVSPVFDAMTASLLR